MRSDETPSRDDPAPPLVRLFLTGAAGKVAGLIRPHLHAVARCRVLSDRAEVPPAEGEVSIPAELTDCDALARAMAGCDGVLHLGAVSTEAPWDVLARPNLDGVVALYEAARRAGVRRVLLGSTNHVEGFRHLSETVDADDPPRPDTLYGATKVFAEAVARLYHDKGGLDGAVIRIGSCTARPEGARAAATWCAPQDLATLVGACFAPDAPSFVVVHGVSDTPRSPWRDVEARAALGWAPALRAPDRDLPPDMRVGGNATLMPLSPFGMRTATAAAEPPETDGPRRPA